MITAEKIYKEILEMPVKELCSRQLLRLAEGIISLNPNEF